VHAGAPPLTKSQARAYFPGVPNPVERSGRGQIQLSLGDAGVVLPRVDQTDQRHRYVGWWAQITRDHPSCECEWCAAARNGLPVYLGFHRRDAIETVGVYKHTHREAA
jgi:hypothetical protein